jgi:probable phosphoglycerate mutase
MVRFVLIRPGTTDFDDQGRIKGNLDIPLNAKGASQVARTAHELADVSIDCIYTSPCQPAEQTARQVAKVLRTKTKRLEQLANLDYGLWEGMRIEDVRRKQPKVYRMWQEHPEAVCPPGGETLTSARGRVQAALEKLIRKHKSGVIAVVAPEPLFSLLASQLKQVDIGDLWKAECACGSWELIEVEDKGLLVTP